MDYWNESRVFNLAANLFSLFEIFLYRFFSFSKFKVVHDNLNTNKIILKLNKTKTVALQTYIVARSDRTKLFGTSRKRHMRQ